MCIRWQRVVPCGVRTGGRLGRPVGCGALLGLVLAALLPGCAPTITIGENAPPPASVRTVLLVPMNVDAPLSARQLVDGAQVLEQSIQSYLKDDLGFTIETLGMGRARSAWRRVLFDAQFTDAEIVDLAQVDAARVEAARSELARRLAEKHPTAHAVVMPSLLLRQGSYTGLRLSWDGVSRPVHVSEERGAFMTVHHIGGKGTGTSLRVSLFLPNGERFFDRYVGLEPVHAYRMTGWDGSAGHIDSYVRDDLFQDPELIADSVQTVFAPYLVPPETED